MRKAKGTIVYQIADDGCINGLYTSNNMDAQKEVYNEIARKKTNIEDDDIAGIYIASWIDIGNEVKIAELEIAKDGKAYILTWRVEGKTVYKGKGKLTGEKELTVNFESVS